MLGIGVYIGYQKFFIQNSEVIPTTDPTMVDDNTDEDMVDSETITEIDVEEDLEDEKDEIIPGLPIDSDGDGLTDLEELEYNTDPELADTDRDGLFDREEVVSWKTDPLNPDSDGDSFIDGDEVKNGYDPLGSGKLEFFDQLNF